MNANDFTRRKFLQGCLAAAAGRTGLLPTAGVLGALGASAAHAQAGDYRALVCVFLGGGNDSFNMLVPNDTTNYRRYRRARRNLALDQDELRAITPANGDPAGLHPQFGRLQTLFNSGRCAFVANTGVLLQPTTRANYQNGIGLPPALFSHNDQTDHWMSGAPERPKVTGWGGRIADLLDSLNGASPLSMNISMVGTNLFQTGASVVPYNMNSGGIERFNALYDRSREDYFDAQIARSIAGASHLEGAYAGVVRNALDVGQMVQEALRDTPAPTTQFPNEWLGQQLRMVARLIAARNTFGVRRQIFMVETGGFDTHDAQVNNHAQLLRGLSESVEAFYRATVELGVANQVTTFTTSEFGRTLTSNGDGTDHGWGGHYLVVGGAVRGGDIYGRMPNLDLEGPDDAGFGRIIPTTSVDAYGATLGRWLGVPSGDLDLVFPNLDRFPRRDLGFMNA